MPSSSSTRTARRSLESRVVGLAKVVYHNKLGTQGERMQRVAAIARAIAEQLGGGELVQHAEQAAVLAKADLLTDMVGEFPELQGIMGRYYAQHDGLNGDVADAIEDHYKPRFAGDSLPRSRVGTVVALADKLETLVGMFGIGQIPTGDKDPFALRRHALGVIRMLAEGNLDLPLEALLAVVRRRLSPDRGLQAADRATADFIYDRLAGSLREQGYTAQEVDAVVSQRPQRLGDIPEAPGRRAHLLGPARSCRAGRRQQAGRQHPEKGRRPRSSRRSTARCSRKPPRSRCTTRWSRLCRRPMPPSSPATTPSR